MLGDSRERWETQGQFWKDTLKKWDNLTIDFPVIQAGLTGVKQVGSDIDKSASTRVRKEGVCSHGHCVACLCPLLFC